MVEMKKRVKVKRTFVGEGSCLGAIAWQVNISKTYDKKRPNDLCADGEFSISDEAQTHWVENWKELKPLYKIQRELDAFIHQMEDAFSDVAAHNKTALAAKKEWSA